MKDEVWAQAVLSWLSMTLLTQTRQGPLDRLRRPVPAAAHLLHSLHAVLQVARLLPVHVLQPAQRLCALPLRRLRPFSRPVSILSLQSTISICVCFTRFCSWRPALRCQQVSLNPDTWPSQPLCLRPLPAGRPFLPPNLSTRSCSLCGPVCTEMRKLWIAAPIQLHASLADFISSALWTFHATSFVPG